MTNTGCLQISIIYDNQQRFLHLEQGIGNIILSREVRTAIDNRVTLILLRDSYKAWNRQGSQLVKGLRAGRSNTGKIPIKEPQF